MNRSRSRISAIDIFLGINVLLFLWMCQTVYYDRFIYYRGKDHQQEFFVYALVILVVIAASWRILRLRQIPVWILIMVQAGIAVHFAGGLA